MKIDKEKIIYEIFFFKDLIDCCNEGSDFIF